ncbi:MAG: HIT family protein [Planctomycetota bacterium]
MGNPDCIFCKIVDGAIPSHTIYADEHVFSFLDIGPLAEGHLLIIPRAHHAAIVDLPPELSAAIGGVVPRLGRALLEATHADGFNVLVNNGSAAGQEVMHVHWHVIPRVTGDGLGYRWNPGSYSEGRAELMAEEVKKALAVT